MKTVNLNAYAVSEMNYEELSNIYGGGLAGDIGRAFGYAVGYVAGCVKDAIVAHGDSASSGAAAVLAYK